ncbi:MAG TPA: MmcQ/YjbR family DNA-binding protein [Ilumatobacter sp.]|nr:MmcQ/YjbR family DNA-binding protein [Ilumatobacter sp.]
MAKPTARAVKLHAALSEFALSLPEAWADSPWGDSVVKVAKKIFVFLGSSDEPRITVKLPETRDHALSLPGASLPGYGLGTHGWVTVPLAGLSAADGEVLFDFVEESYRTVAPKRLVKLLDAQA